MARVLIVDDDQLFGALMRRSLEQRGHHVCVALDGQSGRDLIASDTFDLFVCDIVLPDETGLQVLRDVRKLHPEMALVAVSGGRSAGRSVHIDVMHMAETLGADAVIRKPFALSAFVSTVEGALAKRSGAEALRAAR